MKAFKYAIAFPVTLASFGAPAWDSLTPQEASERCYAGDRDACAVVKEYEQNERDHSSPYEPYYTPRPWGPADQWVPRDFSESGSPPRAGGSYRAKGPFAARQR
jgi:hypothetical protein